jgi:uncharacterized membrane protein YphA (DoxX/SURF4 family)
MQMHDGWNWDAALLVLRLSEAYVFLYAAWLNTKDTAAWQWTVNETGLLFQKFPEPQQKKLALLCSIAGMIMMYGGGISVLLGLEPRLGGIMIAVFSLMGMKLHAIRRDQALKAAQGGDQMGWVAYSANVAAGLKNWGLAGAGVALVLTGAGLYGLRIDYLGLLIGLK